MHTSAGRVVSTCGQGIVHAILEKTSARPPACAKAHTATGFGEERYKKRNTVARGINKLKHARPTRRVPGFIHLLNSVEHTCFTVWPDRYAAPSCGVRSRLTRLHTFLIAAVGLGRSAVHNRTT